MSTTLPRPVNTTAHVPTPAFYECSECLVPTPATEVHDLRDGDYAAYCAECAYIWRPFAHRVWGAHRAHDAGITVTC
jgi:hypothetical protein